MQNTKREFTFDEYRKGAERNMRDMQRRMKQRDLQRAQERAAKRQYMTAD